MRLRMMKFAFGVMVTVSMVGHAGLARGQETLEEKADLWGRMHGAALYCRIESAHDFGVSAVEYFQARVGDGAPLENLKQIYGIQMIKNTRKTPSGELGDDCEPFRGIYEQVFEMLRGTPEHPAPQQ